MDSTATVQAQAGTTLKERDLVAARYRLAVLYSRDRETEVWRALDETESQVVTIEFLLSNDGATRESFLAAGRRMAAVERPAVMKVAAIHDDPNATFIVYQHLVHVPVPLDWLKPKDEPAPVATAAVMTPPAPPTAPVAPPAPAMPAAALTPPPPTFIVPAEAAEPVPSAAVEDESIESRDHGLVALSDLLRAREFSQIDVALVKEAALELGTVILTTVREVDYAALGARGLEIAATVVALVASVISRRSEISLPTPHLAIPTPHLTIPRPHAAEERAPKSPKAPKVQKIREPRVASVKAERAPRGPSRLHIRWRRVLFRGACLAIIATTVAVMPSEAWPIVASDLSVVGAQALTVGGELAGQAVTVGGQVADQATKIGGSLKTEIEQRVASGSGSQAPLKKPTWDVPPLSEYGASLDSKAPDPSARPDATVDWVVALRALPELDGREVLIWGDILANRPELVDALPGEVTVCEWGYEDWHPFAARASTLAAANRPFWVCPGTSSWLSILGRVTNATLIRPPAPPTRPEPMSRRTDRPATLDGTTTVTGANTSPGKPWIVATTR